VYMGARFSRDSVRALLSRRVQIDDSKAAGYLRQTQKQRHELPLIRFERCDLALSFKALPDSLAKSISCFCSCVVRP